MYKLVAKVKNTDGKLLGYSIKEKGSRHLIRVSVLETMGLIENGYIENAVIVDGKFVRLKNGNLDTTIYRPFDELYLLIENKEYLKPDYMNILLNIIPEIQPLIGFNQKNEHHDKDIWGHTVAVMESVGGDFILKLAALLHDIAKPLCYEENERGFGTFKGHEICGAELSDLILKRIGTPNEVKNVVLKLIEYHGLQLLEVRDSKILAIYNELGEDNFKRLLVLKNADIMGCKPGSVGEDTKEIKKRVQKLVLESSELKIKDLDISGNDLKSYGYEGKELGSKLNQLLQLVSSGKIKNEKSELLKYI